MLEYQVFMWIALVISLTYVTLVLIFRLVTLSHANNIGNEPTHVGHESVLTVHVRSLVRTDSRTRQDRAQQHASLASKLANDQTALITN